MNMLFLDESTDSRLNSLQYKLKDDIRQLQRETTLHGQSGLFCKKLSDLIIKYFNDCTYEIKTAVFNKFKIGKILPITTFDQIQLDINQKARQILNDPRRVNILTNRIIFLNFSFLHHVLIFRITLWK